MTETQLPGKLKMAASIWDCRWAAIGGFVVGLFVAVLFFSRGDSRRSLRVTVPTNGGPVSIDLAAENDTMNQVDVLNQLFTDEFSKPGMLAWLANEGIHEIASPQLAAALVNHCDPIPPEPACGDARQATGMRGQAGGQGPPRFGSHSFASLSLRRAMRSILEFQRRRTNLLRGGPIRVAVETSRVGTWN